MKLPKVNKSTDVQSPSFWFCVVKQKTGDEWNIIASELFTSYGDALSYGRSFYSEDSVSFVIYTRSTLPWFLYDWAVEQIREYMSLVIGNIVVR
jgi:hypothetical protein